MIGGNGHECVRVDLGSTHDLLVLVVLAFAFAQPVLQDCGHHVSSIRAHLQPSIYLLRRQVEVVQTLLLYAFRDQSFQQRGEERELVHDAEEGEGFDGIE